jgi:hypothetical protein
VRPGPVNEQNNCQDGNKIRRQATSLQRFMDTLAYSPNAGEEDSPDFGRTEFYEVRTYTRPASGEAGGY